MFVEDIMPRDENGNVMEPPEISVEAGAEEKESLEVPEITV